ncbi:putative protein phosphatase 2C-type [Botrimarina hoheduenensis]|uniref:PPM-type phosphatase domain-containing protein n=2 Tax=Botrimarina hoheduenensis TaxID=2528000 RepID=A0A5C5VV57_9BACT|nr:putative protein phosphatase 2C-type [Botrimarina hoheduenensis]
MTKPDELDRPGQVVVYSSRSPGKPSANEDAAAVIARNSDEGVLIVADGMGGAAAGQRASSLTLDALQQAVCNAGDDVALRTAILNGIESANQAVLEMRIGAATTLAVVEVQGNTIRPYHVGDSAILVVGQRGRIKLLTVSHSPVGMAVEAGVLDDTAAMHHEDRHLVTNAVGTVEMRIEIGPPLQLSTYDTVLLATDGLFDNLSINEVVEVVRKGPLGRALERLADLTHERMAGVEPLQPSKPDDLTMVAFRLVPS